MKKVGKRPAHVLRVVACLVGATFIAHSIVEARQQQQQHHAQHEMVKVEYDKAADLTNITIKAFILISRKHEELRLGITAFHKGAKRMQPQEVTLTFLSISLSKNSRYENARNVTINSADRKYALGEAGRSVQSQKGYSIESLTSSIPYEDFVRIAQSQDIKLRLGLTEIKLNSDQIMILRVAASYLTP